MRDVIQNASWVYECAKGISLSKKVIGHSAIETFHKSVKDFTNHVSGRQMSQYWEEFLIPIRRYRFNVCSSVIAPSYLRLQSPDFLIGLKKQAEVLQRQYPCDQQLVDSLLDSLLHLLAIEENPLTREVRKASSFVGKAGLVVLSERNFVESQRALDRNKIKNVEIIGPNYLRKNVRYDCLIFLGSVSWLKDADYVFSAPRSKQFHLLVFPWMKNSLELEPVLAGKSLVHRAEIKMSTTNDTLISDDHEVLPVVDIRRVRDLVTDEVADELYEITKARLLILHDSNGVLVDVASAASLLVIDREADLENIICRKRFDELVEGNFIILRTSRGGDYTESIADHLLGNNAVELRSLQRIWKDLLRTKVKDVGIQSACAQILNCGSEIVNEGNLRNWMSSESIRTNKRSDFDAILRFIGLSADSGRIWDAMKTLANAHLRAGMYVRDRIIEKMNGASLQTLEKTGKLSVELDDIESGTLTAFKIESIGEEIYSVHVKKIGIPFDLEKRFEWQE